MTAETTFIYGLIDPRNQQIRYIGKSNNPNKRYSRHINSKEPHSEHKNRWIAQVKTDGLLPEMVILEECHRDNWIESERFWISYFKYIGAYLTNASDGGVGPSGVNVSSETRKKLAQMSTGRVFSQERRDAISRALTGIKRSDATKKKISEIVKKSWADNPEIYKKSPEQIEREAAGHRGKKATEETRIKQSLAHKGKRTGRIPSSALREKMSTAMKLYWEKVRNGEINRKKTTI